MIITQTPLRISLAGGGTDFPEYYKKYEGEVVGFTIDKYLFVWLKERFDHKIIVNWNQKEVVDEISKIEHELVRETARMAGLRNGFEIITTADIPSEGSGLGSSSALTVCLLNAIFQYQGIQLATEELARRACQIEIEILKKPIGRQDQYLSAFGGIQHLRFSSGDKVRSEAVQVSTDILRKLNQNLILFYTGITRKASDILATQMKRIHHSISLYHEIKKLVPSMVRALKNNKIDDVGPILHEGWEIKKRLSSAASLPQIDKMYKEALKAGAMGGKLCGAGGGGFLLIYCPITAQEELRHRMKAYAEMPFQIEQDGSKAIFNARRPTWKMVL